MKLCLCKFLNSANLSKNNHEAVSVQASELCQCFSYSKLSHKINSNVILNQLVNEVIEKKKSRKNRQNNVQKGGQLL